MTFEWKPSLLEGNGTIPTSMDGLTGMVAKHDLEPGQVLKMDTLYMPLYVRKGETVTVKATSGMVTISATMRAMASGRLGDTIQVQHLTANGNTNARVTGPRTLEVLQR
jgi:flagella basal body P-ring formation protein FlgA